MEATPTQIINYFSGFKQNIVPLFQRPYTWTEKQWRVLWEDIFSFYDVTDTRSNHFMGAVVTMPARSVPVGVSKFLVIDGQQRLTTVALLMCAIRDSLGEVDSMHRRRIQSFYLTNEGYEASEYYKLLPTQGDRLPYSALINDQGVLVEDSHFKKAYDYFRRKIRSQVDEGKIIEPRRILEIIETRLMVVMINLSDNDDPYLIFESLNFKGAPLEQADLVRNYFLMRFPVADQQAIYEHLWLPMQNRLTVNLTEFMRHFLGAEGEEVRKSDVYASIKRLVADADASSVRLLMNRMERLSTLYSRLSGFAPDPNMELGRYFDHFRRLDFGSVYPLLLALYEDHAEGQFGAEEFVDALKVLHSFIVRRMIVGVPSNSLSGLFISMCHSKPVTDSPSGWLASSLGAEERNRRWPSDLEFEERWIHAEIYGSRVCHVVLECIEEQSGHHEPAEMHNATVEHVMPQTLNPEWEEALGPERNQYKDWLHTIGNLTLTGYNPELGNRYYSEKRDMFALSHFELNRYFSNFETWGLDEIPKRASTLFNIARQIWPRPPILNQLITSTAARTGPAGFHAECIRQVEAKLGIHLFKVSQTRYASSEGEIRLVCAVSAEHNENADTPYYWYGFHQTQLEFLEGVAKSWVCLGCGSPETTLLIPLSSLRVVLSQMSVTKTEDRYYWHLVVHKKNGKLILRLLGGQEGPELTAFQVVKPMSEGQTAAG
jgi:hypothetical protein